MRRISPALGAVAKPDLRRRHERVTPLLGGTGFYLCIVIFTVWAYSSPGFFGIHPFSLRFTLGFLAAITVVFAVGAYDDRKELRAPPKFIAQTLAAVLVLYAEPTLPRMLEDIALPQWGIFVLLVVWIVGITNAVNMIDGLDGLCAGVAGLSAFTMAMTMIGADSKFAFPLLLALVVAGACGGFLFHNFNPARIFLGDSGSNLLGFALAIISMKTDVKRSLFISLSIPIALLGLPLLDICLSMIRRQQQERSLFRGDRSHLHHRLQQIGLNHRSAVILLWSAAAYLNLMAYFLTQVPMNYSVFIYVSMVPTVGFWMLALYFVEKRLSLQSARYSHLFIRDNQGVEDNQTRLRTYLAEETRKARKDNTSFTIIVIDAFEVLKQIVQERPTRVIEFYMELYEILKARLRGSDLVVRISERKIVAVLPGVDGAKSSPSYAVIQELSKRVKVLQESYNVFQADKNRPEGFHVLIYPQDSARLIRELGFDPALPGSEPTPVPAKSTAA